MRVLVVDDSAFMRTALARMLDSDPDITVVGKARNGQEGVDMVKDLRPDVVTMDIEMPELDGLGALRRIMAECPTPVIMCSSLSTEGSHAALKALALGAFDCIAKDASQISTKILDIENDLITKVKAAGRNRSHLHRVRESAMRSMATARARSTSASEAEAIPGRFDLIVIGASTGGPPVVERILEGIPAGFGIPIVVAQHMPVLFTKSLSERLNDRCKIPIHHGESGMRIQNGHAYVLPGGEHGRVVRARDASLTFDIGVEPKSELYRPSVNELMRSAAKAMRSRVLGIMLTGMGSDGLHGAEELVKEGGHLIAQTESSCVVYGMPKAVTDAGLVHASMNPDSITALVRDLKRQTSARPARLAG